LCGLDYFREQCKKLGVDEKSARKVESKLAPLLERATEMDPMFNKALYEYRSEMEQYRLRNILLMNRLFFDKIKKKLDLELQEISLLFLIHYLFMVEGPFVLQVDVVVYSLIAGGKKLYSRVLRRNVTSFSDLEYVTLKQKLDFLEKHKLHIISKVCDRDLRNHVAHLTFRIDDHGTVHLKSKKRKIPFDDFNPKYESLREMINSINVVLLDFYYHKYVRKT
jgi:hypothetical protein